MNPIKHPEDPTWRWIRRLGFAGLIPFVFLALCLWLVGPELHPVSYTHLTLPTNREV